MEGGGVVGDVGVRSETLREFGGIVSDWLRHFGEETNRRLPVFFKSGAQIVFPFGGAVARKRRVQSRNIEFVPMGQRGLELKLIGIFVKDGVSGPKGVSRL